MVIHGIITKKPVKCSWLIQKLMPRPDIQAENPFGVADTKNVKGEKAMADITWKYVKPLSKIDAIEDFEKENNISLPLDLKKCIKANNGGRPSLKVFDTDDSKERVFKTLLSFNESDVENIYKYFPIIYSHSNNLIPFASDPFGNYICLQDSKVVLFLHETGKSEYIADSFSGLLEKLHE